MTVNERLKIYLKDHGIKQQFLAEKLGIGHSKVSRMLNGDRKITAEEIGNIAKVLNISTDIFFENYVR